MACSRSQNNWENKLTNNSSKYWYRYNKDPLKPYSLGYCFYSTGTFVRYYNPNNDKHIRMINNMPPVYSDPVWRITKDSTIMIGKGNYFKIIFFNSDSIVLKSIRFNDYLKLHRDMDQMTKPISAE